MTTENLAEVQPLSDTEVEVLRAQFPILSRTGRDGSEIAYLDASATAQKPQCVIDTLADFYRHSNAAVNRGTHLLGDESTAAFDDARDTVARFIGGRAEEIAWTKNATEGLNLVAHAVIDATLDARAGLGAQDSPFVVRSGQRIVVTRAEHHANLIPWQRACRRLGIELAYLDLTEDGRIDLDTLDVIDERTRVVAVTHASNVTGAISPVADIVRRAREVGAMVVLDTCQSAAHMPVDVRALDVDFAVMSSHKMCGPTGVGALWGRAQLLEQAPPFLSGGSMIADVTMEDAQFMPSPTRFEAGSQPVGPIVGWARALDFLSEVGMERIHARESQLLDLLIGELSEVEGVRVLGPRDTADRLGVVSFVVDGVHPHDVGQFLDASSVAIRVGHHCAIPLHRFFGVRASGRASMSLTTTREEIIRCVEALRGVRSFFAPGVRR